MSDTANFVLEVNGQPLMVNGKPLGVTVEVLQDAVQQIEAIPADAKMAVKDFIEEKYTEIVENKDSIFDLNIDESWLEKIPDIFEYLEKIVNFVAW
ncbi:hypothetical protein ACONUD_07455 [Microbulbifer harenosus]|uniref:Uncharacterized protein n=1 Tax=Microbulbifer harenosus TaxID=2576840 RepID=A0ABY2UD05_9GAMM|nr:hypothetical protein [Microbulbifer harenosus]TLM73179.1 hypothetical protein FDY93_19175 [Microbulbifer harenosus]